MLGGIEDHDVPTRCDTYTSCDMISHGPDGRLRLQRGECCRDEANNRKTNNPKDIFPVYVFVPV